MIAQEQAYSEPLVTIGLPTYNRAPGLKRTLECIAAQTYKNIEIIISDNCSTDPTVQEVIQSFAPSDTRITAYRQAVNVGLEENFNFVFAKSTAEYFMWMSDDDYFDSNYVEACVRFLIQNPDHVLCSGTADYYDASTLLFKEKMFQVDQATPFSRLYTYFSKVGKNGNFYGVFRNKLLLEKPIGLHIGCDWSLMAKFAILGKLTYINTTSYHRSAEGNSETKRKMIQKFKLNKFESIFFETYIAAKISTNIFNDKTVRYKFNFVVRSFIVCIIFTQINIKLVLNFIKKKLGMKVH